jgi:hypothetical protein
MFSEREREREREREITKRKPPLLRRQNQKTNGTRMMSLNLENKSIRKLIEQE